MTMQWLLGERQVREGARRLAFLGLLLAVAGCGGGGGGGGGGNGGTTGTSIRGRVMDTAANRPVSRATVSVGGRSTTTGSDGRFSLATSPGTVAIIVRAEEYHTGTFSAVVQENVPTDVGDLGLSHVNTGPPPPPL